MSDALPLPPRPNLEQYKKLARDFQNACKSTDPTAIRRQVARWLETLAQLQDPESPLLRDQGGSFRQGERDREAERTEQR